MIESLNIDCMEYMSGCKDNAFDLAICDPPYGIGLKFSTKEQKDWNNKIPTIEYFNELIRVSKEQIIWGINYYPKLPNDKGGRIIWYKQPSMNNKMKISECDLAFYSKHKRLAYFHYQYYGNVENGSIDWKGNNRIHPTEKPVKLYEWLLMNFTKAGDKIIDTHSGSLSIGIACHNMGFDLTACEKDTEYYEDGLKRLRLHQQQLRIPMKTHTTINQ